MFKRSKFAAIFCLAIGAVAVAQPAGDVPEATPHFDTPAADPDSHPVLSGEDHWAWILMGIVALGFFVPAAIFGPIVRSLAGEEMPELHDAQEHDAHHATQHEPGH